ncbi:MAG: aminotransferase class V-fold PLP-dependent enzyme [Sphingopyxis sp.]|nr:aminotransferase class V-fold PLP-dependent enzyme [Sphingopyxis sp.]
MLYLDYQATTPLAPEARAAMLPWLAGPGEGDGFANPASNYRAGRAAAAAVEVARDQVAALLPSGGRLYFTSGATEAINWALFAAQRHYSAPVAGTAIEHAAAIQCLERLNGALWPVNHAGIVAMPNEIAPGTIGACMLVNNEVGTIQPVMMFADAVHAAGGLLLCDAVQGFGRMVIPEGPDFIAVTAHKIHGPKGVGALWVKDGVHLPPLLVGGAQEEGMRSGTVSPALVAGFGAAAALAAERIDADTVHVARLWDIATDRLNGWTINGTTATKDRYRGNLNIRRDGINAARLLSDARRVAFSLGSACGSGSGKVSHVLRAMGLSEVQARSSIRLGWGRYTTEAELDAALGALLAAAKLQGLN